MTPETLPELLDWRAMATPEAECLRFGSSHLSCAELRDRVARLATVLQERGVGPGDRVAAMMPNGLDFPLVWLAAPLIGGVVVPVNPGYRGADLGHVLRHSEACYAVVGPDQLSPVLQAQPDCPTLAGIGVLGGGTPGRLDLERALASAPPLAGGGLLDPEAPVTIQYTSGTTGLPKGCVLDHRYWLTLARTIQETVRLGPGDVMLTAQLQSYMDPSWNLVLALLAGVPLVILPRFSASGFWHSVIEHEVTFFYCIGTMPMYLMRQPPDPARDRRHRVRLVYCSGIPPSLHRSFEERWGCPWRETYGTTELGVVLIVPPDDSASVGSGSMGRPVPGKDVRLALEDGEVAPPGQAGELRVRGAGLMQGYFRNPEATRTWKTGGWARTGDLVVEDPGGGFRMIGRIGDMIRRAGENVSAAELEGVLMEHPAVRAAACIPVPDELRGEEIKAYVEVVPTAGKDEFHPEALRAFVASRLARFKVPRFIEYIDGFPLTSSEKIAKAELIRSREDHRRGSWDGERQTWEEA